MNKDELKKILKAIKDNKKSIPEAIAEMSDIKFMELKSANIDLHRPLRNGFSEVILGKGKTFSQIHEIVSGHVKKEHNVFVTKVENDVGLKLMDSFPKGEFNELAGTFKVILKKIKILNAHIAICTAGTADIPIAEEALETCRYLGLSVDKFYDVGVAGIHRLFSKHDKIKKSDVVIVVAGMEGALPSVMGGIYSQPIIAVPTSVGYGINFGGYNALFSMLGSCSEGISVVNIDNGFGAACAAFRIVNFISNNLIK